MKVLLVKSIPLSEDTQNAWKNQETHDVKFLGRNRDVQDAPRIAERYDYDLVVNLGNSGLRGANLVNSGEIVELLKDSKTLRESALGAFMPPPPLRGDGAWVKGGGFGGKNKQYIAAYDPDQNFGQFDVQRHVAGREYRVITVGDKIVQVQRRIDNEPFNPAVRQYEWIGVRAAPKNVKQFVKHLLDLIPHDGYYLVGWDVIVSDNAIFLFEGNTCPGVNEATAGRILKQLEKDFFPKEEEEEQEDPNPIGVDEEQPRVVDAMEQNLLDAVFNFNNNHVPLEGLDPEPEPRINIILEHVDEPHAVPPVVAPNGARPRMWWREPDVGINVPPANVEMNVENQQNFQLNLDRIQEKLEEKIVEDLFRNIIGDLRLQVRK